MGCLVGSWPPGDKSRYRFVDQQCEAWEGMRIQGTILVAREETTYIEIILGFRIQGEARRESLGAPQKEASRESNPDGKAAAGVPAGRMGARARGARGWLWGAWTAVGRCGLWARGECRPSGEPRPCSHREHEEGAGEAHAEAAPFSVEGTAAPFPACGRGPFCSPSRADTARWAQFSSEPGPRLEPRLSLRLPALSQNPEPVTLPPAPSPEIVPDSVPSSVPVLACTGWYCVRFGPRGLRCL